MKVYGGIYLHSDNSLLAMTDEQDKVLYRKRLPNELPTILEALEPHREPLQGLVVESTYNWYWLVDGLMDAGYRMHLANTAAIVQYEGLKHTDGDTDAMFLAKLLRLGILSEGHIYPKEGRAVRELLRKRGQRVRQRTANLLSVQNLFARNLRPYTEWQCGQAHARPDSGAAHGRRMPGVGGEEQAGHPLFS